MRSPAAFSAILAARHQPESFLCLSCGRLQSIVSLVPGLPLPFTVAVGVFRRGGSQEIAPATERDRGGVP